MASLAALDHRSTFSKKTNVRCLGGHFVKLTSHYYIILLFIYVFTLAHSNLTVQADIYYMFTYTLIAGP